jgi:CelD/BcsL family acetyltransferase involved in cellulose biosynthesis
MHDVVTSPQELTILDIEDQGWAAFVAGHPDATAFHHPSWAQLLGDCYRLHPRVAAMFDGGGAIVGGLPIIEVGHASRRRWVSLPFTDRCAPLVRAVPDAGLLDQLEHLRQALGLRSIEVRHRLAGRSAWIMPQGHWHELRLAPEPDELYAGFHKLRARLIKRAEREGVVVERAASRRELCEEFYGLHVATRRRLGVPVQPRRFFELLWDRMLAQELGYLLIARKGTTPIASAVFLASNGRLTYKFSASDSRYARLGGTNAVIWEAIRSACRNGDRALDFGRTEEGNSGLRAFKLGWGAREEPLEYTVIGPSAPSSGGGRARQAVGAVIRHSPGWVARAIGAVAYRYTASAEGRRT